MALRPLRLNRTVDRLRRYRHILAVLTKYGFDEVVDAAKQRFKGRQAAKVMPEEIQRDTEHRSRPQRVRLALQELGPTFIKLGQLLSTRPDLVPTEYAQEFETLQDQVAPVAFAKIEQQVERELGGPIDQFYAWFDPKPLAAGSIAQVHRARTRDGVDVAVKVRRPDIVTTIEIECEILEDLAGLIKALLGEDDPLDPVRMVHEFTEAVSQEVDLDNEARNLERFGRNFANDPNIHIPEVIDDCSTEGVLTMTFVDGIKASHLDQLRAAGIDTKLVASRGAEFILKQLFEFGFFHTDPHPGNIFVQRDNVIAPLDFGQVARLGAENRRLAGEIILGVADRDSSRFIRAFQRAEIVTEQTDVRQLRRDLEKLVDTYSALPLKEIPVGQVIAQAFELLRTHRLDTPPEFTLMLKSLMTIESLANELDPEFELISHLKPYARRLTLEPLHPRRLARLGVRSLRDGIELLANLPEDLEILLARLKRGQVQVRVQHEHLENLVTELGKSSDRISFALIIAGTVVGSSQLVTQQEGSVLGLVSFQTLGILGYIAAAVLGAWLLVSIIRGPNV